MHIVRGIESILIGSENPRALAEFYRDTVGLKITMEMEIGDNGEEGFAFEDLKGAGLYITHHSEVKGSSKQPERILINFEVEGKIENAVEKIKKKGVKVIKDTYHVENYGQIATFEDPDGNYFQLVQVRASSN